MTILNEPWREVERAQRRRRIQSAACWIIKALVLMGIGFILSRLI